MEYKRFRDSNYLVYRDGRIYSENFGGKFKNFHDNGIGYMYVGISMGEDGSRKKKKLYVHRMVAECFVPNPNGYNEVNHINGIKNDNRAENLEWVTEKQNAYHAVKMGLMKSGSKCFNSSLLPDQVYIVRLMGKYGFQPIEIERLLGVSAAVAGSVIGGRSYKGEMLIERPDNVFPAPPKIRKKVNKKGLPPIGFSEIDKIKEMYISGKDQCDISDILNIPYYIVCQVIWRKGIYRGGEDLQAKREEYLANKKAMIKAAPIAKIDWSAVMGFNETFCNP